MSQTAGAPTLQIVYDEQVSDDEAGATVTTKTADSLPNSDRVSRCFTKCNISRFIHRLNHRLILKKFPIRSNITDDLKHKIKMLLLGCGQVGKSTMFKQICQIYGDGFQPQDIEHSKQNVYDCIIDQMKQIIEIMEDRRLEADYDGSLDSMSDSARTTAQYIGGNQVPRGGVTITPDLCDKLKTLWAEPSIKRAYHLGRSSYIGVTHSAMYLFDSLDRIVDPNYVPTTEDILKVNIQTTGMRTGRRNVGDTQMTVVDTGGQRNERSKWIHEFSHKHCVVICIALDHFDRTLFEEDDVNAMHEQLLFFHTLMNENCVGYRYVSFVVT